MVSGRCGQDGERLQQVLREKDALDLEGVLRKGKWVRNKCRKERGRKECGCWGPARIPASSPTMLWGHEGQSQELRKWWVVPRR